MKKETINAASEHALSCYPRESCGLVIVRRGKERYIGCTNRATTKSEHFKISGHDFAAAEDLGKVTGIVHSHPDAPSDPSDADLVACEESRVPWHIIAVHHNAGEPEPIIADITTIKPHGYVADYVGRQFSYGVLDCFTLVQDWYQRERGIYIERAEGEDGWWYKGKNVYLNGFKKAGFVEVSEEDIQVGDVILMQVRQPGVQAEPDVNHAAIYVGNTQILQHLYGRLSSRDVYGGYWREVTRKIVRYKGARRGK